MTYPQINPVAFSLGPIQVHWYGLMYLLGFMVAWGLARWRTRHYQLSWSYEQISDLIFYLALGVIIGGRVGYVLFYDTWILWTKPWEIFAIWQGGMSFHGGLLGVAVALYYFSKKQKKLFLDVTDFVVPLVPFGLAAGRLGNFINGELWGRVTTMPWGMVFPSADEYARHPSQLYELGLEGIGLFILTWAYGCKKHPRGRMTAVFLMGYAICRFTLEFFREPDAHMGFIFLDWMTMGQILSIPMFLVGIYLWRHQQNISNSEKNG